MFSFSRTPDEDVVDNDCAWISFKRIWLAGTLLMLC